MGDVIQVDKGCEVRGRDGAWHPGRLTAWWRNPRGTWEGCVIAPTALEQTGPTWVDHASIRPAKEVSRH